MYGWLDLEMARQHREDLLREGRRASLAGRSGWSHPRADYAEMLMLSRTHAVEAYSLKKALHKTADYRSTELTPLTEALDTLPSAQQRS